jgi:hypothetical protein
LPGRVSVTVADVPDGGLAAKYPDPARSSTFAGTPSGVTIVTWTVPAGIAGLAAAILAGRAALAIVSVPAISRIHRNLFMVPPETPTRVAHVRQPGPFRLYRHVGE